MEAKVSCSGTKKEDMRNPSKQSVSWHNPILLELRFTDTGAVEKRIGYGRRWAAHQSQVWLMDDTELKKKRIPFMAGKINSVCEESSHGKRPSSPPFPGEHGENRFIHKAFAGYHDVLPQVSLKHESQPGCHPNRSGIAGMAPQLNPVRSKRLEPV